MAAVAAACFEKEDVVYFLVPERPVERRDVQPFQDRDLVFRLAGDEVIGGYIPAGQVSPYCYLRNDIDIRGVQVLYIRPRFTLGLHAVRLIVPYRDLFVGERSPLHDLSLYRIRAGIAYFDAACKDQGKVKHCQRNVFHIPHLFQSIYPKRR